MEILMKIVELVFKLSVLWFMFATFQRIHLLREYQEHLWNLIDIQVKYTDQLKNKIEKLEEELKSKKKGAKKNGTRHEIKN